jgi:hypothetical protein
MSTVSRSAPARIREMNSHEFRHLDMDVERRASTTTPDADHERLPERRSVSD